MRRFAFVVALVGCMVAAIPAHAQDILGLSFRPTDAMPEGSAGGLVDFVSTGTGTEVSIDLSSSAEGMSIEDFDGASDFVVWAVDMKGARHNLGPLNADLVLESAPVDFLVARVFVTAEADANATQPTGDRLYEVTLRGVEEVDSVPEQTDASEEATEEEDADAEEGAEEEAEAEDATPKELPTTGDPMFDLMVLVALATVLIGGGLRLRTVKL